MSEQLSFRVKPILVRHPRDDRPATRAEPRFAIDEGFFMIARHAEVCAMCKMEIERHDPDHGYDYRRDIRWCAEYRRMHAELFYLIGVQRG